MLGALVVPDCSCFRVEFYKLTTRSRGLISRVIKHNAAPTVPGCQFAEQRNVEFAAEEHHRLIAMIRDQRQVSVYIPFVPALIVLSQREN